MKWISLIMFTLSLTVYAGGGESGTQSKVFYPKKMKMSQKSNRLEALKEVVNHFARIQGIDVRDMKFKLASERQSHLGTHYRLIELKGSREIKDSEIIITVKRNSQDILRIFNSLKTDAQVKHAEPLLSESQAIKTTWDALAANDQLIFMPTSTLNYQNTKIGYRLVYEVKMSVADPYGHWVVLVDAVNGEVLSIAEQSSPTKMRRIETNSKKQFLSLSFDQALTNLNTKKIKAMSKVFLAETQVNGQAQVFNPNPNTSLNDSSLNNHSDLSAFEAAYRLVTMDGLTQTGNGYELRNDEVLMTDFDTPSNTISISDDGSWIYDRSSKGEFLDSMTFFHIRQSMNYLKDLGFRDDKKIFRTILKVDSNGAGGADNSFFSPGQNALSFGHGCVPDNEDSDVILHELGHAIQHNIVDNWSGGDTGAMGEGFGDYWASSYSLTTENGGQFHPEWVFKWDGHNDCWAGRFVDKTNIEYDHTKTYRAHAGVNGGVTDELWSTPIFQAFKELYEAGTPREIMDTIIIESHFGLGSGLKMRDMAEVIVKTAEILYPQESYDQVYKRHFMTNKILE